MIALAEAALVMLFAGLVVVAIIRAWSDAQASSVISRADREELARLRVLVDDLRELGWSHREIDPDLATIMLEKIRVSERRGRELP